MLKSNICVTCTKTIQGRSDKVYCGKECQNEHHKITKEENFVIQKAKYNKRIIRNFVVLRGLMSTVSSSVIVHRNNLKEQGFDFHHFLKRRKRSGKYVYQIKEFQFRFIGNGKVEVKRLRKGAPYSPEFIDRWSRIFTLAEVIVNVSFEEGSEQHFEGDVYYYFERISNYMEKCLVASATNLLRLQKEKLLV